jgi:hypothetical protein
MFVVGQAMTQDIPKATPNVRCSDCGRAVKLIRRQNNTLALFCDCTEREGRLPAGIPGAWKQ